MCYSSILMLCVLPWFDFFYNDLWFIISWIWLSFLAFYCTIIIIIMIQQLFFSISIVFWTCKFHINSHLPGCSFPSFLEVSHSLQSHMTICIVSDWQLAILFPLLWPAVGCEYQTNRPVTESLCGLHKGEEFSRTPGPATLLWGWDVFRA